MLWAVTSYFNPLGYRRRRANYLEFRRRLACPLVAVELGYRGRFELAEQDADVLIRLDGRDVLWQKERLLNVALEHLPVACRAVACIDCDVFFGRQDWAAAALAQLEHCAMVQPFAAIHHLARDWRTEADPASGVELSKPSVAYALAAVGDPAELLEAVPVRQSRNPCTGFAWAYRREVLERHGLFDGCIAGGGDTAMVCAAYGKFDSVVRVHGMNAQQQRFYRDWAEPFFRSVRAKVGWIEGDLYHLWHGRLEDRRAHQRHIDLQKFDFDPFRDIAFDPGECWRWSSHKPRLHAYLADYMAARREDG